MFDLHSCIAHGNFDENSGVGEFLDINCFFCSRTTLTMVSMEPRLTTQKSPVPVARVSRMPRPADGDNACQKGPILIDSSGTPILFTQQSAAKQPVDEPAHEWRQDALYRKRGQNK